MRSPLISASIATDYLLFYFLLNLSNFQQCSSSATQPSQCEDEKTEYGKSQPTQVADPLNKQINCSLSIIVTSFILVAAVVVVLHSCSHCPIAVAVTFAVAVAIAVAICCCCY
ncbi:hypothetical protein GQX74_004313 [Glossina fuscipes]|nr:hypothetical protein GQX74_004313 [Glossina fuscipes]